MKKKFAALALAAALSLSLAAPAFAAGPTFLDVPTNNWAWEGVEKAFARGLVTGTAYNEQTGERWFAPDQKISGVEMLAMAVRAFCPDDLRQAQPGEAWYAPAVEAAAKNGYLQDLESADMTAPLTREQMVAILYNAAGRPGSDADTALAKYTDRAQLSAYAVRPMAWAVGRGVISGTTDTTLSPAGTATRSQIAAVMVRYIEKELGEALPVPDPGDGSRNGDGTTNAGYVNKMSETILINGKLPVSGGARNPGKDAAYPTTGTADEPNGNGYYTEADVDINGANLEYEALAYLNAFLAKEGREPATWTTSDEAEEYTLMRAKEAYANFAHERPDGTSLMATENLYRGNGNAKRVIDAWEASGGHQKTLLGCGGREVCIAKYGTVWVLTGWPDVVTDDVISHAPNNYYW